MRNIIKGERVRNSTVGERCDRELSVVRRVKSNVLKCLRKNGRGKTG